MSSRPLLLEVRGPLRPADLPGLYARACVLLAHAGRRPVELEVVGVEPDAVAVAALARLALAARRHGCPVRLRRPAGELRALLELCGLWEVFGA